MFALRQAWRHSGVQLLFIVSNPPFLPLVGYLLRVFCGTPYVILVYDIYPDILIRSGRLTNGCLIARIWRRFNKVMLERAEAVFTIGDVIAKKLTAGFDPRHTPVGRIIVVSNWVDATRIKPIPKEQNAFVERLGLVGKLTILYSGNFGMTHDVETIIAGARLLRSFSDVHFLLIGGGGKWSWAKTIVETEALENVTVLPFVPESQLPLSLAAGDVAVVTLGKGADGLSFPSKTFYSLAAGSALLAIASGSNELARLVHQHECGLIVDSGDAQGMVEAVLRFREDPGFLETCRRRARWAAETYYGRENTAEYAKTIRSVIPTAVGEEQ
ncbi:glycosyltransferase family 4 protein [Nitrospiraceae bacterium AH_259_D15_M11_P09]|nr:glycosyltransferase family 4 protein [Nitrospiraceae bacterium AH_259_D15_M11_P09]